MAQEKNDKLFGFAGKTILIIMAFLLLAFAGISFYVSIVLTTVPTSEVINKDAEPLTPGEVWAVDDQFAIWIDRVEEVSAETAQTIFPEIQDTADKRYFDIAFSFRNDGFEGCYYKDELQYDYLNVRTDSQALDENLEVVYPAPLNVYEQDSYYTALQNDSEIPVTAGITSTSNHLIVEIGTASGNEIQPDCFSVRFIVSTEILSSEATIQYRQDYIIPIP